MLALIRVLATGKRSPMIAVPGGVQVWLATGHTDMRKGFDGLALLVQEMLKRNGQQHVVLAAARQNLLQCCLIALRIGRQFHCCKFVNRPLRNGTLWRLGALAEIAAARASQARRPARLRLRFVSVRPEEK